MFAKLYRGELATSFQLLGNGVIYLWAPVNFAIWKWNYTLKQMNDPDSVNAQNKHIIQTTRKHDRCKRFTKHKSERKITILIN